MVTKIKSSIFLVLAGMFVLALTVFAQNNSLFAGANKNNASTGYNGKITICHQTGNGKYNEITIDQSGLNGHSKHSGDIIPAPAGGCPKV